MNRANGRGNLDGKIKQRLTTAGTEDQPARFMGRTKNRLARLLMGEISSAVA
jgi:hypothetical protein